MRIAICDDEIVFREKLKEYCLQFAKEQQVECQIVEYASGEEVLQDSSPDVLLLDIEMKGSILLGYLPGFYGETLFSPYCMVQDNVL